MADHASAHASLLQPVTQPQARIESGGAADKATLSKSNVATAKEDSKVQTEADVSPTRPRKSRVLRYLAQWEWATEVLSCLISAVLVAAIASLLQTYDGADISKWRFGISINTIVSILVTFLYLFLMVPIASSLAQLKWNHYEKSRTLYNFGLYESAARSTFGSAKLILKRPKRSLLALLAAGLTLSIQAVGPFVQQIISSQYAGAPYGNATLPVVTGYIGATNGGTEDPSSLDLPQKAAIFNGLYKSAPTAFNLTSSCINSNCTWEAYHSLAVCSTCTDMSNHIATSNTSPITHRLPNGLNVGIGMKISAKFPPMNFDIRDRTIFLIYSVIQAYPAPLEPVGYECMLQFCVRSMEAYDHGNGLIEWTSAPPIVEFEPSVGTTPPQRSPWVMVGEAFEQGSFTDITIIVPGPRNYTINTFGALSLANFLIETFTGVFGDNTGDLTDPASSDPVLAVWQAIEWQADPGTPKHKFISLPQLMDNVAESLTQFIRTPLSTSLGASSESVVTNAVGSATITVLKIKIDWGWIALPVVLLLLVIVLLLCTWLETRRLGMQKWGDSPWAALFHGLDEHTRSSLTSLDKVDEMEDAAKRMTVCLSNTKSGKRLM